MLTIHPTHNAIIAALLHAGALDTKEIHRYLIDNTENSVTLAQLYNILKQLYNSQIISKYDKKYQINMLWINQLEDAVRAYYQKTNQIDRASFVE
jgi:Fe2+ or Zn2+ uptake regulation protein